ncbi:hypothetical protein KY348_00200 [Candidatus Woesearchaeota archaeon]|nr:hypothetical protein [Candidatus Woesearchaeota archaeon]
MTEVIIRAGVFSSILYMQNLGIISLNNMSLDTNQAHLTIANHLYSQSELTFPYKRIDIEEGILERILTLSKNPLENLEAKNKEVKEIRAELKEKYVIDVF